MASSPERFYERCKAWDFNGANHKQLALREPVRSAVRER